MLKVVLFDLDGTLINTNPLILKTFELTFQHFLPLRQFSETELFNCIGPTLEETFGSILPEKCAEMIEYYQIINRKLHDEMVSIYPSVREGLETLKNQSILLGIVSSKKSDMVHHGLRFCKIEDYFQIIIGADQVKKHKPDPEAIYLAMEKFGVDHTETIFVGDNSQDILGGKNASVITCGVAWALRGAEYLNQFNPDYILNDMNDLVTIINEVNFNGKTNL